MNIRDFTFRNYKYKKASIFVEAAIVLPIFFLAILSIALTIRLAAVEAKTMESFSTVSQEYAKEMYLLNQGPLNRGLLTDFTYEQRVKKKVQEDEKLKIENPRLQIAGLSIIGAFPDFGPDPLFGPNPLFGPDPLLGSDPLLGVDPGLVNASLLYEVNLPMPLRLSPGLSFQNHLLFRGFIGREGPGEGFGFDEMEKSDNPNGVFVFPRAGERYHRADCRIIEVYPVEKILSPSLKKKYSPCKLCKAGDLPYGSKVYCFEATGKVYHKGICTTVDRYVVEIDREEAIERGYTPCAYCGGQ